ncbi:MAG TPA: MFS transporter [Casimicrobiaceae bacterium]|jgi:MFS transporter, MHS family, shikimate and dehydroshikimate transport protein|nr:MFS transporter [Casimicrobiaceae bacterium]
MATAESRNTLSDAEIRKVAFASAIGCTIEWYDFFLYNTFSALVFNKLFFPSFDPLVGTMLAFTGALVGYVARPVAGVVFGHFGDRLGRKKMLILTLLIMGIGTFLIGCLPTYDSIGVWAPVLLLVLRVAQGLGVGGEWGGAVLMAVEHSPPGRRGFYGSWPQVGVPAGLALATGMVAIFSSLPGDSFIQWAWRVPFLLSLVLVGVGVYIRMKIMETPAFMRVQKTQTVSRVPFMDLIRKHPKQVVLGMGCRYIEGVGFNIYGVFVITYLATVLKLPRTTALLAVTLASIVMLFFIPMFGRMSDQFGRRKVFGTAAFLTGILAYPAFWLMSTSGGNAFLVALAVIVPFGIVYAAIYGPEAALFSELFDTRVRYSGISFVYQFSGIFASGLTPIIATALLREGNGQPWLVATYMLVVAIISTLSVFALKETADLDLDVPSERFAAAAPAVRGGVGD